jgi:hypothetical protein
VTLFVREWGARMKGALIVQDHRVPVAEREARREVRASRRRVDHVHDEPLVRRHAAAQRLGGVLDRVPLVAHSFAARVEQDRCVDDLFGRKDRADERKLALTHDGERGRTVRLCGYPIQQRTDVPDQRVPAGFRGPDGK